ncbi:lipopolysaccharide biosynthesis protein [Herpetosiphon llansteffanensis]
MQSNKPQRSLTSEVWSATLWNTLLFPARFLVGIITSVIYYGRLAPEQVALIFLLTSLAASIGTYADLGIERSLPRFIPEVEKRQGRQGVLRFLWRMIGLKLAIMAVLVLGLNLLAQPMGNYLIEQQRQEIVEIETQISTLQQQPATPDQTSKLSKLQNQRTGTLSVIDQIESQSHWYMLVVSALLILGALFDVFMQFLTAYFKQRAWNLITLVTTLLQPILVTIFILLGWGITGVLIGLVLTPLVSVVMAAWQAIRASRELSNTGDGEAADPALPKRFVKFAAVSYLMQITTWVYDIQFVTLFTVTQLSPRDVAILAFAYKFAKDYLGYIWMPLNGVMTPLLSRIKLRRDPQSLQDAHGGLARMIWLLIVPAGVGLALLTPRMVAVLYPLYTDASSLIIVFIAFTFGESLLSVPHNVLMVYEQYRAVIISRLFAFISVPLVFLLLPRYGMLGVAIAVGAVRVATRVITLYYGWRNLELQLPWRFWLRVCAASASFAVALFGLMQLWPMPEAAAGWQSKMINLLPLMLFAALGAGLYLLTLRLLGGLDPAERERLLAMKLPFKGVLRRVL